MPSTESNEPRDYRPDDREEIERWAAQHGVTLPRYLPVLGWFVVGRAYLGFERIGDRAWLEPAIVNPSASYRDRWTALNACVSAAETFAAAQGVGRLLCLTDRPTVARFAVNRGYLPARGALMSKEIRRA